MSINFYTEQPEDLTKSKKDLFKQDSDFFQRQFLSIRKCFDLYNGNPSPQMFSGQTFMFNNQTVTTSAMFFQPNAPYYNEIRPLIRTLVATATRNEPAMTVWSIDNSSNKYNAVAKVAEDVNNALYHIDNEGDRLFQAGEMQLVAGQVYREDYWDWSQGPFVTDANGNQVRIGSNAINILTPLEIGFDFTDSFEKSYYVYKRFIGQLMWGQDQFGSARAQNSFGGDLEAMYQMGYYPLECDEIQPKKSTDTPEYLMFVKNLKMDVPFTSRSNELQDGEVEFNYLWLKPTVDFPQGRKLVWINDVLVYATPKGGENPDYLAGSPCDFHPITTCANEGYIGRALGKSAVEMVMPIILDSIELRGLIKENEQTVAKPQMLAAKGSLAQEIINAKGVNITTVDATRSKGFTPQIFMGVSFPAAVYKRLDDVPLAMMRILGSNGVLGGDAPAGVTAASALEMLQQNSGNQAAPMCKRLASFEQRALTKKLKLFKKYHSANDPLLTSKIAEMARKRYKTQVDSFVGAENLSDEINVEIESASMLPKNETQKTKSYLDLLQQGFYAQQLQGDQMDAILFQNELQKRLGLDPIDTDTIASFKKADWIVDKLLSGQFIEPDPLVDDSNIITHVLKKTMLNPDYLESTDDNIKQLFVKCYQMHTQLMQQQQQQQKQEAMADQQEMIQQQVQAEVATSAGKDHAKVASEVLKSNLMPPKEEKKEKPQKVLH